MSNARMRADAEAVWASNTMQIALQGDLRNVLPEGVGVLTTDDLVKVAHAAFAAGVETVIACEERQRGHQIGMVALCGVN